MRATLGDSQTIRIRSTRGNPPERYEIEYCIKSLQLLDDGRLVERADHVAEIILTTDYPRYGPQCRMLTPIFHPNINDSAICIGDHWAASESLADLVVRIGEIIAYQSHNTKSPLNADAARWVDENLSLLPIDDRDLLVLTSDSSLAVVADPKPDPEPQLRVGGRCANCWAQAPDVELIDIGQDKLYCADCVRPCPSCGARIPVGSPFCSKCEGRTQASLTKAQEQISRCEFTMAQQTLADFLQDHPDHSAGLRLKADLQRLEREVAQLTGEAHAALRDRRLTCFLAACRRLHALGVQHAGVFEPQEKVEKQVQQLKQVLSRIISSQNDQPLRIIASCEKVLDRCADLPEAEQALRDAKRRVHETKTEISRIYDLMRVLVQRTGPTADDYASLQKLIADAREKARVLHFDDSPINAAEKVLHDWRERLRRQLSDSANRLGTRLVGLTLLWALALSLVMGFGGLQVTDLGYEWPWFVEPLAIAAGEGSFENTLVMFICLGVLSIPLWQSHCYYRAKREFKVLDARLLRCGVKSGTRLN